jgi:hypothetical protein
MKILPDDIDNRPETRSNPYDGVGFENESHGFKGVCSSTELKDSCFGYERYKAANVAQTKLLEYLKGHKDDVIWITNKKGKEVCRSLLSPDGIESMLKEIQEAGK